jgi:hypothetical protein
VVVVAVITVHLAHAQAPRYGRGDTLRLVAQENGDPYPDSRVVAIAGDHVHLDRSSLTVDRVPVQGVSRGLLQTVSEPWDQLVPEGHYFVVGERGTTNDMVRYYGLIPAKKILGKI